LIGNKLTSSFLPVRARSKRLRKRPQRAHPRGEEGEREIKMGGDLIPFIAGRKHFRNFLEEGGSRLEKKKPMTPWGEFWRGFSSSWKRLENPAGRWRRFYVLQEVATDVNFHV